MSETMKGKTLLKGHTLRREGSPIGVYQSCGVGVGGCSCGAKSPELQSNAQRKAWHREHKDEIRGGTR